MFNMRHWLAGKLFRLALWVLPDCASKTYLDEHMDGMFWIKRGGRCDRSRTT